MKNNSKLKQYCGVHRYVHNQAYELCDYCMEHKHYLHHRDKYCNYGFSKYKIAICNGCEDSLFGGRGSIVIADEPYDMYERICQVIKDKTTTTTTTMKGEEEQRTIEYFEVVRIAYLKNTRYFIEYFGSDDDICYNEINKNFKGLWRLTYRFVNEEQRIKVANRNPDNLLVSWVEGCYTEFDIPIDTFV
jgi:hypothetical protein